VGECLKVAQTRSAVRALVDVGCIDLAAQPRPPCFPGLAGDIGAVVEVHEADAHEVEFVVASGRTQALLTLSGSDVRSLGDQDLLSARSVSGIAARRG
jgi:hypothetical protein